MVANYEGYNFSESTRLHSLLLLLLALFNHPPLAIKSLAPNWSCMWLPLMAKFSSFRMTIVNLADPVLLRILDFDSEALDG